MSNFGIFFAGEKEGVRDRKNSTRWKIKIFAVEFELNLYFKLKIPHPSATGWYVGCWFIWNFYTIHSMYTQTIQMFRHQFCVREILENVFGRQVFFLLLSSSFSACVCVCVLFHINSWVSLTTFTLLRLFFW